MPNHYSGHFGGVCPGGQSVMCCVLLMLIRFIVRFSVRGYFDHAVCQKVDFVAVVTFRAEHSYIYFTASLHKNLSLFAPRAEYLS